MKRMIFSQILIAATALLSFAPIAQAADCLTQEEAIQRATKLFIDEYFVRVPTKTFEDFFFYFYENGLYSEDEAGVKEAFFSTDHEFDSSAGEHVFRAPGEFGESYAVTYETRISCEGGILAQRYVMD